MLFRSGQGSLAAMRYTADVTFGSQTVSATCPYTAQLQDLCDAAVIGLTESGSYAWGSAIDTSNGAVTGISLAAGAGGEAFVGGDYVGSLVFGGSPAFAFSSPASAAFCRSAATLAPTNDAAGSFGGRRRPVGRAEAASSSPMPSLIVSSQIGRAHV